MNAHYGNQREKMRMRHIQKLIMGFSPGNPENYSVMICFLPNIKVAK